MKWLVTEDLPSGRALRMIFLIAKVVAIIAFIGLTLVGGMHGSYIGSAVLAGIGALTGLGVVLAYLTPAILASRRGHRNDIAILALNLLAGVDLRWLGCRLGLGADRNGPAEQRSGRLKIEEY